MSASQAVAGHGDPTSIGREGVIRHVRPVSKRIIVGYGFWIFLLSDIVMFSAFFATYAVLVELDRGRTKRSRFVPSWQRGT